ncbi:MAG TPA: hypothetical protein VE093_06375 [Polyangiaceae bacterium]|nr:hypothetical protein [Polyangiaceae bacterium]
MLSLARREGHEKGLREGIETVCDVLGTELSDERQKMISELDAAGLTALLERIKKERRWLLNGSRGLVPRMT